jgi:large subunit ribosomal protein L32
MAEPKKRATSTRSGNRRSHLEAKAKSLSVCPQCKKAVAPHKICANCGFYNGQDVLEIEKKQKEKAERRKEREKENE